jgi:hypothetical protein
MRRRVKPEPLRHLLIVITAGLAPVTGWAYGQVGHQVVGFVAERKLCDEARTEVAAILDGQNLARAGYWADRIRGEKEWQYMKPWHYINIPDGVAVADAERSPDGDVLFGIAEMNRRLDDESLDPEERAQALKFLVHFVGDIHQPLHVGREEDLGGNKVEVRYFVGMGQEPGEGNLHSFWDTDALDLRDNPPPTFAALIANQHRQKDGWDPGTPEEWVEEAMALRPEVYNFHGFKGGRTQYLSREYQSKAQRIIGRQLALAGLRLAAMLNERFCTASDSPEASE